MTLWAVMTPFLVAWVFGRMSPLLARRLPPAVAAWLLTAGSVLIAMAVWFTGATVLFVGAASLPRVAAVAGWSSGVLRSGSVLPLWAWAAGTGAAAAILWRTARRTVGLARDLLSVRALSADVGGRPGELIILDGYEAFALPFRGGRIVLGRPLLDLLDADQQRSVIAHERSHLAHRHHLHRLVAQLSATALPLLRPATASVIHATERWADEDAAAGTGRATTATAIGLLALTVSATPRTGLTAAGGAVTDRVAALLDPRPRLRAPSSARRPQPPGPQHHRKRLHQGPGRTCRRDRHARPHEPPALLILGRAFTTTARSALGGGHGHEVRAASLPAGDGARR